MHILKFGGTSVGSPESIVRVLAIVQARARAGRIAVVVSAFNRVTDQLIECADAALRDDGAAFKTLLAALADRHVAAINALLPSEHQGPVTSAFLSVMAELEIRLEAVQALRELTAQSRDAIVSCGERSSALIIAAALRARGMEAEAADARQFIVTDAHFGHAAVQAEATGRKIRAYFDAHPSLQVVTGFIAATEDGRGTTLGRGGSDYTASILGEHLRADEIEIWTDVSGVMTADPRRVSEAFPVPRLTYQEAMELSHFGAKVLFAPTMEPARRAQIPIRVLNTFEPDAPGTVIGEDMDAELGPVSGLTSLGNMALLMIRGSGLVGIAGTAERFFRSLSRAEVNVILISQGSSEHSICIAVRSADAARARAAVEREFASEARDGFVEDISVEDGICVVAVAGEKMRGAPGVAGRVFGSLGENGVNIKAIAQGSSERSISFAIRQTDETTALHALHDAFFQNSGTLRIFLAGTGLIGGTLLEMLARNHVPDIRLLGVMNTKKMVSSSRPVLPTQWRQAIEQGAQAESRAFIESILQTRGKRVFVDCTPGEDFIPFYAQLLRSGVSVVTPNKKANCRSLEAYRALRAAALEGKARFLYETNVGGGLPILSTLRSLRQSGDTIRSIDGVLSGTLSYLFNAFDGTVPFSALVRSAKQQGYTEPDPRDDLSGADVGRKLLILAREMGLPFEQADIQVESLVPARLARGSADSFLASFASEDGALEQKRLEAADADECLRYCARIADGTARVRLERVPADHPCASLRGADNIVAITSDRYAQQPLIIRGPGAGAAVTAGGVLQDILRCAS